MSRDIDRLARGPFPRMRVQVPKPGERCHRHHRMPSAYTPCMLCNPKLVPASFGGDSVVSLRDAAIIAARLPRRQV